MHIRLLFSVLIAAAMLFAPAASAAHAMASSDSHQQMMSGHCQSVPSDAPSKAPAKNCCIALCVTLAIAPAAPAATMVGRPAPAYFAAPQSWHGFLGELATPPPRHA